MIDDKKFLEEAVGSEVVFKGRLLEVRRDAVRLANGEASTREYVIHPGAVVVLAFLENGNLLFERQFRYPLGKIFLELPAGKVDPGEEVAQTAARELLEETGFVASSWEQVGTMHPCIGYSNEKIEIFIAGGLEQVREPLLEHGEFLEVVELSLADAASAVCSGSITDAKTITALYWAQVLGKRI